LNSFADERGRLRRERMNLVMTNGCFDLLHTGHIYFLQKARQLGDRLLVALNSDASVRALKGPARPVQGEAERAFALGALACVDYIVLFTKPDLANELEVIAPDIYTKAGDYNLASLDPTERRVLEMVGAQIHFLPFLDGFSTTSLIRKITQAGGAA